MYFLPSYRPLQALIVLFKGNLKLSHYLSVRSDVNMIVCSLDIHIFPFQQVGSEVIGSLHNWQRVMPCRISYVLKGCLGYKKTMTPFLLNHPSIPLSCPSYITIQTGFPTNGLNFQIVDSKLGLMTKEKIDRIKHINKYTNKNAFMQLVNHKINI